MLRTQDGKPFATSLIPGFVFGFIVSTVGAVRVLSTDTPHRGVFLMLVAAPMVVGLGLLLIRSWRDFGIGMMLAAVVVSFLGGLLVWMVIAAMPPE